MQKFETNLLFMFVGGLIGVAVHAFCTDSLFVKGDLQDPASKTAEFISERDERRAEFESVHPVVGVPTATNMAVAHDRFVSSRVVVFGRETWVLYDKEMNTQFVADAHKVHEPVCWAAVNPAGG